MRVLSDGRVLMCMSLWGLTCLALGYAENDGPLLRARIYVSLGSRELLLYYKT